MLHRSDFCRGLQYVVEQKIPFCRALDLKLAVVDGRPQITMAKQDFMLGNTRLKVLHGGVTASVLDTIAGVAVLCRMAEQDPKPDIETQLREFGRLSTIDLRVDYLEPARGDEFVATAVVSRLGQRVANVQMRLEELDGRCVATGAAAFSLRAPRSPP